MLTWIVYVLVITLLLSGAALAAEYAARLRHSARSRWIWALTIVASLIIPTLIASVSIQVPSLLTPTVARNAKPLRELTTLRCTGQHHRAFAALRDLVLDSLPAH